MEEKYLKNGVPSLTQKKEWGADAVVFETVGVASFIRKFQGFP